MCCDNSNYDLKESDCKSYIAIHATILSIIIAVAVSFAIYYKGLLYNVETSAINEAEKINNISFVRSVYFPDEGFGRSADNINASLKHERTDVLKIEPRKEKHISKLSFLHHLRKSRNSFVI